MSVSRFKRCGLVAISLFLVVLFGVLCFDTTRAIAADDPESASFYKLASSASAHVNDRLSKNEGIVMPSSTVVSDDGTLGGGSIDFADAGGMLGYCDEADTDGIIAGWINSALSSSSATYSYSSLRKLPTSGGGNTSALYMYCKYGYLLSYLGLDSTSAEVSFDFFRFASGILMTIAYITAFTVDIIFSAVVGILKTVNPFRLFTLGVGPIWSNYLGTLPNDSPIYGLAMSVSSMYQQLSDLSWTVIMPVFLVFLVFSLLVLKSTNHWGKIKKYIVRVVFIAAGIPLLGSMYTMSLDALGDPSNGGMGAATRIVQSTFCDFEAWAKNRRLGVPSGGGVQLSILDDGGDGSRPSPESEALLRSTCYSINRFAHGQSGTVIGGTNVVSWNNEVFSSGDTSSTSDILTTLDMLGRYMSGSFFYASDWETLVKAELTNESSADSDYYDVVMDMLGKSDSASDFKDNNHFDGSWGSADIWGNGSLTASYNDLLGGLAAGAGGEGTARVMFSSGGAPNSTNVANPSVQGGLSTMSMYNYLTSKFTKSNVVVFSNERASSGFIRESHRSVNMIGTGVVQVMYFLNAFIMLIAMTIIGWCYGFGILFSNIKRTFRIITSVPFAMLGSIRGIAKVLTYALVMIIEIIGSLFVYSLIVEVLMNLSMIVEQPIMHALGDSGISASAGVNFATLMMFSPLGSTLTMILLIVNCIVFILFIIMAIRLRKVIVKSLDEAAAAIVNKFLDVDGVYKGVNEPKKPSAISRGAGAVAQGAGMAAGSRLVGAASSGSGRSASGTGVPGTSSTGSAQGSSAASGDAGSSGASTDAAGAAAMAGMAMGGGSGGADAGSMALSGSADAGAGFGTDNADADDKALASQMLGTGGAPNPAEEVKDKLDEENEKAEDKAQAELDNMTGKTDAMEQENNEELKSEIAKEERREGAKKLAEGAADTAVGVAKMAAAAETGDAKMLVDGAKQTEKGMGNMKEGTSQAAEAGSKAESEVNKAQNEKNETRSIVADSSSTPPARETSSVSESHSSSTTQENRTQDTSNGAKVDVKNGESGKPGTPGKSSADAPRTATAKPSSTPVRQSKPSSNGPSGGKSKPKSGNGPSGQGGNKQQKKNSGNGQQMRSARPSSGSSQTRPGNVNQTNVTNNSTGGSRDVNNVDVNSKQLNKTDKRNNSRYDDKRRNENRSIRQANADKRQAQNKRRVSAENQRYGQAKDERARIEQHRNDREYRREQLDNEAYSYQYRSNRDVSPADMGNRPSRDDDIQYNVERETLRPAKKRKTLDDSNVNDDI